jgi:hypothetical protein
MRIRLTLIQDAHNGARFLTRWPHFLYRQGPRAKAQYHAHYSTY